MYTRSSLLVLALVLGSVHASDPNTSQNQLLKRVPDTLQNRTPADALAGLVEIRAPSDFDLVGRTPTPVAAAVADPEPAPVPEAAAELDEPFELDDESPLLGYDGAEVLGKRTTCVAQPLPSAGVCGCPGQTLCKKNRRDVGTCFFLKRDEASCGTCFHKCGSTQQCKKGVCKCSRQGYTACQKSCVNLQNDERNCGRCGNWCPYDRTCRNGTCRRYK